MSGYALAMVGLLLTGISAGAWDNTLPWWWNYGATVGMCAGMACIFVGGRRVEREGERQ